MQKLNILTFATLVIPDLGFHVMMNSKSF